MRVPLADTLEAFETGKRPKGGAVDSGIPSLGGEHVTADGALKLDPMKYVPQEFFQNMQRGHIKIGDVLVVKDGATTGRVGIVEPSFPYGLAAVNEHLFLLRADSSRLDARFLYFYLRSAQGQAQIMSDFRGAAQGGISREIGEKISIPLLPLTEQQRIVDLLSRAEGIVRLRREAQKKVAEIIPALFLDMFGDPATNPKGWPETTLGEVVDEFRYGTSQKSGESGLPTLRIPNVIGDRLDPTDMKLVAVSEAEANRLRLCNGDILFVRTNGNPEYVGRSAVYERDVMQLAGFDGRNCLYASYLIRARLKHRVVNPRYLQSFLSSSEGRKRLREQARTSAGQYNINTEGLGSIRIPIPPLDLQEVFEGRCRQLLGLQQLQSSALRGAETTFTALLVQVFAKSNKERLPLPVAEGATAA